MTYLRPHLAPEARYRPIPHPVTGTSGGTAGIVLDEVEPLQANRIEALNRWLASSLHPVEHIGTTNAYIDDNDESNSHPNAPLYQVGNRQLALNPDYLHYLHMPMVATVLADAHLGRFFGLAADGTLIIGLASLDPAHLNDIDEETPR
jgi:hypothetical protein